jgi:hypothetical protein
MMTLATLIDIVHDLDERIAIMHYGGGMPLPEAEEAAVAEMVLSGRIANPTELAEVLKRTAWPMEDSNQANLFLRAAGVLTRAGRKT